MTPLKKILIEEISANGPMLLADYMARALGDPDHGYYMQRRPFGHKTLPMAATSSPRRKSAKCLAN